MFTIDDQRYLRESCWSEAVTACIRVFLLRIHSIHHDAIGVFLSSLCEGILPAAGGVEEANSSDLVQFICQQVLSSYSC